MSPVKAFLGFSLVSDMGGGHPHGGFLSRKTSGQVEKESNEV